MGHQLIPSYLIQVVSCAISHISTRNRSGNADSSVAARDPLHIDSAFVEDCCRQTRSACLVSSFAEIAEAGAPLPAQALTPRDTCPKS